MTSQEIRELFLKFFESKGHVIVPSAPMVIKNDPTLMFTNAGMNQFKEFFLGNAKPKQKRVVDTQKCLRVSGKHNDLEEVGRDTYHHTMFEMLGNWSFGDYFKREAITWAWELLTEVYKIPKENLYVTVFEGSPEEGVPFDQEAYDIWKERIAEDHILLGNKKDNFWEMGDQGPCGPCSEIHVDIRSDEEKAKVAGRDLVNNDHPQVIEIWNNVFMEFNRKADGSLEPLKMHVIDTGMGFERLVRLMQGKNSNYDTDIFTPVIEEIERLSGKKYNHTFPEGPNGEGIDDEQKVDIAMPCATQNEMNEEDAKLLHANGVTIVAETSNMGCTAEAAEYFVEKKMLFAPGKAVNAGGVATSGLEMTQNAMHLYWTNEEVDAKLHQIMSDIHEQCVAHGREGDYINYVKGANIAGFLKVAQAMLEQGVI